VTDRYAALEKIQRLRAEGVLTDAEFATEKQRILDEAPIKEGGEHSGGKLFRWAIPATVLGLAAVSGTAGWMYVSTRPAGEVSLAKNPDSKKLAPAIKSLPPPSLATLPQAEQIKIAFRAVFGVNSPKLTKTVDETSSTTGIKLVRLAFGPVLLTSTKIENGCHGCAGALGVYYLTEEAGTFRVVRRFPKAVEGWGWGEAPTDWSISDKFAQYPVIVASGGYTGQGITCSSTSLTELRPEGPVQSELIPTGYSNEGAVLEETGQTTAGDPVRELDGKIAKIVKGKSFVVEARGTETIIESYARKGATFARTSGESRLGC
jgi:Short C-terminal domain